MVRLFDPGLYEELLSPPMSPQTMDLTITQQFDTNAISANTHVHDSEIGSVSRREDTTDSTLPTRPQMISGLLTTKLSRLGRRELNILSLSFILLT